MTAMASNDSGILPRELLFGNPEKTAVRLSPDGEHISYLAPRDGVLNVWVAPAEAPQQAQPVTNDQGRGVRNYFWAYTNKHIIYRQDEGGDENWQVHVVDVETHEDVNLTPFDTIEGPDGEPMKDANGNPLRPRANIQEVSHHVEDEILISLNNRNPQFFDIHRLNILTGEMEMIQQNDRFFDFMTDDQFRVRLAFQNTPDGGNEFFVPGGEGDEWTSYMKVSMEDMMTTSPIGFDQEGDTLYMLDSRGRNTAALFAMEIESKEKSLIYEDPMADVSQVMIHPVTKEIEAAASEYTRVEWTILDDNVRQDIEYLRTVRDGDINVTSRTLDDARWIVAYTIDDGPVQYYRYDRDHNQATFLFSQRPALQEKDLASMHPVVIHSRDGMNLVSYLTLPPGVDADGDARPEEPQALVLLVHGGPWARDNWGYHPIHQWLSNRGYAVLSVNFRGSTGFGKDFLNAGNREWAGKMHDDLIDAVNWAIDEKIADPGQVAIMGGSYGGYATLVGLTFTPEVFACGVDIVGPSNIQTLLETIPPYWEPMMNMFKTRVGDHTTEEGQEFLRSRSPLHFVDQIQKPLLIGQGANDPRVKQSESDQIVEAMQNKDIPVTYVLYPDEGHGFARPENRLSFYAVTELFLAETLGGRYQPIGDDFANSSIEVPEGAAFIPTLSDHLP